MASAPKVGTAIPTSVTAAARRVVMGSGASGAHSAEGVWATQPTSFDGAWPADFGDGSGQQQGSDQYPPRHEPGQPQFTPLVGRLAASYPATSGSGEGTPSTPLFLTDLLRGVGIYEFNMKLFAGTLTNQGSVINRIS